MRSLNRVFLLGHLGHDPEITLSKTGRPYTRLNVATHRVYFNSDEEKKEVTEWHSVFVWGPLAERCTQHLRRGSLVFVEGALTYWQVAVGEDKKYRNAVHAQDVRFLSSIRPVETREDGEDLDNPDGPGNHNAVAHPA